MMLLLAAVIAACGSRAQKEETASKPEKSSLEESVFPRHEPYGQGVGAAAGRVIWAHDPDSVKWDGEGYWWEPEHFDEPAMLDMVHRSITSLGDEKSPAKGWETLFQYNNEIRGKRGGYRPGEKIAIKTNINGAGTYGYDEKSHMSYTNPVLLKALLLSLVEDAGAAPGDITVYDVTRIFPAYMMEMCTQDSLKGVQFRYLDLGGEKDAAADTGAPVVWSKEVDGETNYLPACVTEAEYLINLANLKGHDYGITLCAKNHFGSLDNSNRLRAPEAAGIHRYLTQNKMGAYTVLVDLMANYQLGEKTVLYMLDAFICPAVNSVSVSPENSIWQMEPFNQDYTSSIFVSQDPVAIDSVGADFLINEPAMTEGNSALKENPNVENYLHEAGFVSNAPSGTVYYNGDGKKVDNLGVHEHWNNTKDKKYSRNLGEKEGIELVYLAAQ